MPLTRGGHAQAQSGVKPQTDAQKQNIAETEGDDEPEVKIPADQLDALLVLGGAAAVMFAKEFQKVVRMGSFQAGQGGPTDQEVLT